MMSFCIRYGSVKKVILLIFLFMQSMVLQAEAFDTSATKTKVKIDSDTEGKQLEYNFPPWPERPQVNKERVPPPPPGPYMSLALTDFSVNQSSFGGDLKQSEIEPDSSNVPMEAFSPDIPWPEEAHQHHHNLGPTKRWLPENGYHYVKPQVKQKPYPATPYSTWSSSNYRYMPGTNMNMPYMNLPDSRGAPSMDTAPGGSSFYNPSFGMPNYGSGHSNPVIYNPGVPSGNSIYRAPYPLPSKP